MSRNPAPPLSSLAIYLSPQGHRCKLVPMPGPTKDWPWVSFEYLDGRRRGGFCMSWTNMPLMKLWRAPR